MIGLVEFFVNMFLIVVAAIVVGIFLGFLFLKELLIDIPLRKIFKS